MIFAFSFDKAVVIKQNDTVIGVSVNPNIDLICTIVREHNVCSSISIITEIQNESWDGNDIFDIEFELSDDSGNYKQVICLSTMPLYIGNMPNGFVSWQETHFEIVSEMEYKLNNERSDLKEDSKLQIQQNKFGRCGLFDFAKELTDKFEEVNKGINWGEEENDFFDTINDYTAKELN